MSKGIALIGSVLMAVTLSAQNIKNLKSVALSGDTIVITYDLFKANTADEVYSVQIFSSHNSFSTPLAKVLGDVGDHVLPGKGRKATWLAGQELTSFEGDVSFKIRATLISAPWRILNPEANSSLRRGKKVILNWSGMSAGADMVKIVLWNKGTPAYTLADRVVNNGQFQTTLPKLSTGSYELRVSNINGPGVASASVQLRRRTPSLIKVVFLAVAGGGVYFLTSGTTSSKSGKKGDSVLPGAPDDPTN